MVCWGLLADEWNGVLAAPYGGSKYVGHETASKGICRVDEVHLGQLPRVSGHGSLIDEVRMTLDTHTGLFMK